MEVKQSVTVLRSPMETYRYWHNFEHLPRFMDSLESVQVTGGNRSHWKVKAPAGIKIEWDAEIVEDRENEFIVWHSLPGASVENSGIVRFVLAPGGRGTEVHAQLRYNPPAGPVGELVATYFGEDLAKQVRKDLDRFKQVLETGEITRSDATVRGGGPAQPPEVWPISPGRDATAQSQSAAPREPLPA